MSESAVSGEEQPIVQPRLIRFLKNRRKLLGGGIRDEFWEEIERNVTERRKPDTAAERAVGNVVDRVQEASFPVAKRRVKDGLSRANEGALNRL